MIEEEGGIEGQTGGNGADQGVSGEQAGGAVPPEQPDAAVTKQERRDAAVDRLVKAAERLKESQTPWE